MIGYRMTLAGAIEDVIKLYPKMKAKRAVQIAYHILNAFNEGFNVGMNSEEEITDSDIMDFIEEGDIHDKLGAPITRDIITCAIQMRRRLDRREEQKADEADFGEDDA